ncbi:MAG: bifunctional folylpolyglutamate synthase/dihydrofolate synthase [Clostridia bacterium]|nr:bifunctional folylpolyglutamate synthase/dihydrofolate synthase [Clostridia bacterium]
MDYNEAINYIETAGLLGSKPGLSRIKELCRLLGDPQEKVKYIHVAGTNGKGSVCAMLNEILIRSGLKTGLFTSPHLCCFEERIRVGGFDMPKSRLAEIIGKVKNCADKMSDKPTEFEIATAAAFLYFYEENCDIVVLETGLGGRLDATNIIKSPLLTVITGIGLDHTAILGDTLWQIAYEKGGIIKENVPLVLAACHPAASGVLVNIAKEKSAPLISVNYMRQENVSVSLGGTVFDFDPYGKVYLSLAGLYQADNAAAAITAAEQLKKQGLPITEKSLFEGLKNTRWQARFEVFCENPIIIYDGAHNPQGAAALVQNLNAVNINRAVFVSGVMKDKDYRLFAEAISPLAETVLTVKPDNPRALDPGILAGVFKEFGVTAEPYNTVKEGVRAAVNLAKGKNIPLIICGSLYMYKEVKSEIYHLD